MYYIQFDEICKKHNFELEHDAHGDGVNLKYPAGLAPKYTLRLSQNHLPEEVSAMAEKYGSDRFAVFMYNAAAAAGNTISLAETLEENKKVSAALSDLADDLKQAELEAKTWVCTDPDTCQWRRQVGGTRYELYDIFEAPNGTYFAVHGEVDPTEDMTPGELEQLLRSFDGLVDDTDTESERWALTAEAQFETEALSAEREVFDTFEEAEAFIQAKVNTDNAALPKPDPNDEDDELWKLDEAISARNAAVGVVKTRLDTIRSLDKLRLSIFLQDVHSHAKDYPNDNLSWCEWLSKADDGHLLDVEHVSL